MELTSKRPRGSDLKGLLASRQGTLLVALVCAVAAAVIIALAINGYRNNANSSNAQSSVLVATGLIQKGTSGSAIAAADLYTPTKMIEKNVSQGAITDAAVLTGKVAVTNILPGQQLTLADFSVGSGVASELATNERAVAIPLDAAHGLGSVLQVGDYVDVYVGLNTSAGAVMKLLISNVPVISTTNSGGSSSSNSNVVLGVNANDSAELAYASDNGRVWLVLRSGGAQNTTQQLATAQSILLGRPPIQLGNASKP